MLPASAVRSTTGTAERDDAVGTSYGLVTTARPRCCAAVTCTSAAPATSATTPTLHAVHTNVVNAVKPMTRGRHSEQQAHEGHETFEADCVRHRQTQQGHERGAAAKGDHRVRGLVAAGVVVQIGHEGAQVPARSAARACGRVHLLM